MDLEGLKEDEETTDADEVQTPVADGPIILLSAY